MQLAIVTIVTNHDRAAAITESILVDLIWAAALPGDSIEHVSVRLIPRRMVVGVFAKAVSEAQLCTVARALVTRACEQSKLLRGGTVHDPADVSIRGLIRPGRNSPTSNYIAGADDLIPPLTRKVVN
jgi:hypothetical protein